jgi:tRNA (cmo5U34)-methyltransferase
MNEQPTKRDETMPEGRWVFDGSVTEAFDDMLARSIPQYEVMRDAALSVGKVFAQEQTDIIDIGCSRGEALASFVREFRDRPRRDGTRHYIDKFVGVDVSEPMLAAARERFKSEIAAGRVSIVRRDLREGYPFVRASVTLSLFTLQFVPIEHRQRVLQDVYDHTVHGGAIVLIEKVLGETAQLDRLMVDRYYQMKSDNGYSQEAIDRKRLALEGVLVPVTASWNMELLRQAGFRDIDTFWGWMNFRGFVGVKR